MKEKRNYTLHRNKLFPLQRAIYMPKKMRGKTSHFKLEQVFKIYTQRTDT